MSGVTSSPEAYAKVATFIACFTCAFGLFDYFIAVSDRFVFSTVATCWVALCKCEWVGACVPSTGVICLEHMVISWCNNTRIIMCWCFLPFYSAHWRSLAVGTKSGYKFFSLSSVDKLEQIYECSKYWPKCPHCALSQFNYACRRYSRRMYKMAFRAPKICC